MFLLAIPAMSIAVLSSCETPSIPHPPDGRQDCLSCHSRTAPDPYPHGHAKKGYTNDKCLDCHKPAEGQK